MPFALAAAWLSLLPLLAPAPPGPARAGLGHLGVKATEYHLELSRASAAPGRTEVQLVNKGQDAHDVALIGPSGRAGGRIGPLKPGERRSALVRLSPGRWTLLCTLPRHAARGMRAVLAVRRR